jgi:hypothetical protein
MTHIHSSNKLGIEVDVNDVIVIIVQYGMRLNKLEVCLSSDNSFQSESSSTHERFELMNPSFALA